MAFDFKGKKYWDGMSGTAEVPSSPSSRRLEKRRGLLTQTRLSDTERRSNHLPEGEAYSVFLCEEGRRYVIPLTSFTPNEEEGVVTSGIVGKPLRGLRTECDGLANRRDVRMGDRPDTLVVFKALRPGGFREVLGPATPRRPANRRP